MEYVGIFEGGGAKGFAHVGALKATEERGIQFSEVGGTSAGAIIAALVAAGFKADELYQPESNGLSKGKLSGNISDLFDAKTWQRYERLTSDYHRLISNQFTKKPNFFNRCFKLFLKTICLFDIFT